VVNAAGLGAIMLARRTEGLTAGHVPPAYFSKGSYFALPGASPFRRLIYPIPIPGGAGIHLTLDLGGGARFGPDVEAVDEPDYVVDPARAGVFYGAIRRYWPGLPEGALQPAYAGVRPKIVPAAELQDFVIQGPAVHGVGGLFNLFGIESPGLTASLAIAAEIGALMHAQVA
jgi:L-2-hydroxyglutarate oxidase LhgO